MLPLQICWAVCPRTEPIAARDLVSTQSSTALRHQVWLSLSVKFQVFLAKSFHLAAPQKPGTQSTPVPSTASVSSHINTKTLSRAPTSVTTPFAPTQNGIRLPQNVIGANQEPAQRPLMSPKAQAEASRLVIHIPLAITYDRIAIDNYVNSVRCQYAIFYSHAERTVDALRRLQVRWTARVMAGNEVPQNMHDLRDVLQYQETQCLRNIKAIRTYARGTRELPSHATLMEFASRPAVNAQRTKPRKTKASKTAASKVLQNSLVGPPNLQSSIPGLNDIRSSIGQHVFKLPPRNWVGYSTPFERNKQGELKRFIFTADELRTFFAHHTKDGMPLKLWIQKTPETLTNAHQHCGSIRCRFSTCAHRDQRRVIAANDIRVALDEPQNRNNATADPTTVVGYVHLLCLEQNFHLPTLIRKIGNVAVEVFHPCMGFTAADSAGIVCKPTAAIASKFVQASLAGRFKALFVDYPGAGSQEEYPIGFTGQDELTLAYKLHWAHKIAANEVYKLLNQSSSSWRCASRRKKQKLAAPKEETPSSPFLWTDYGVADEAYGLDGMIDSDQTNYSDTVYHSSHANQFDSVCDSSQANQFEPGYRSRLANRLRRLRGRSSAPEPVDNKVRELVAEGDLATALETQKFRQQDAPGSCPTSSESSKGKQSTLHPTEQAATRLDRHPSPVVEYQDYDSDGDFQSEKDFPEQVYQSTTPSALASPAEIPERSDLTRCLSIPMPDKVSALKKEMEARKTY